MANIGLSGYNLNELKSLQGDVAKAIKDREQQDVQKARDQILAIAKDAGISVDIASTLHEQRWARSSFAGEVEEWPDAGRRQCQVSRWDL